jgi:copper transport protein
VTRSAAVPSVPTFDDRAPAGPFTVLVHVAPAGLGPEEVTVRVVDSAGGSVAVEHVAGRLALPERDLGPFQVRFLPGGSGEFTGKTLVVLPGRWELTLSVQLDALTDYVTLSSYDVR